ncbi:thymidylate kinase, partial [Notothenia coriiceps]|uniref:Thymidylate kinase n=1 Tax=Notothenia coriiceps TaxID=8208 RepID=A0A6I9PDR3_9TELE
CGRGLIVEGDEVGSVREVGLEPPECSTFDTDIPESGKQDGVAHGIEGCTEVKEDEDVEGTGVSRERTTTIGQLISAYLENKSDLEDHTVHLLFSANRWELVPLMKKKLEQGTTLVVDRYAFSGVAFTSAKPGFCLDWCMKPDVGLPKPDLVMFLQLSPAEAALRGQFGEERYETSVFQRAVQQKFEHLMKDPSVNWRAIDASQSVEDVHENIMTYSLNNINAAENLPLGELWK